MKTLLPEAVAGVKIRLRSEILFLDPNLVKPDPNQPRKDFDAESIDRLADSIRKTGQLQPILVRKEAGRYFIVAGERRWRAIKKAGIANIQALLCRDGDTTTIQLVENLLREELKPVEQARAFKALMDKEGWSARQLATQLSIEHTSISRALRLLQAEPELQEAVDAGHIPPTTAYEIVRSPKHVQAKLTENAKKGIVRGADLRKKLTLGEPNDAWTYMHRRVKITVSGHTHNGTLILALEAALEAARNNKALRGGVGH